MLEETGPAHEKNFISEVKLNGKVLAKGAGTSKKMSEMEAARLAIEKINIT